MPFGGFKDWEACVAKMRREGHDEDSANRICGRLKAEHEGKKAAGEGWVVTYETAVFRVAGFPVVHDSEASAWRAHDAAVASGLDPDRLAVVRVGLVRREKKKDDDAEQLYALRNIRRGAAVRFGYAKSVGSRDVVLVEDFNADDVPAVIPMGTAGTLRRVHESYDDRVAEILFEPPYDKEGWLWVPIDLLDYGPDGPIEKKDDGAEQLYALRNIRIKDRIDPVAQPAVPHRLAHADDLTAEEIALLNGSEAAEQIADALSTLDEAIAVEVKDGDEGLAEVLEQHLDELKVALATYSASPEGSDEEDEALEEGRRTASALASELERRDPFARRAGLGSTLRKLKACMEALGKAMGPVSEAETKRRRRKRKAAKAKKEAEIQKAPVDDAMAERQQYEATRKPPGESDAMTPAQRQATVTWSGWKTIHDDLVDKIGRSGGAAGKTLMGGLAAVTSALAPEDVAFVQRQMKELGLIAQVNPDDLTGPKRIQAALRSAAEGLRKLGGQMDNKDLGGLFGRVAETLTSDAAGLDKFVQAATALGADVAESKKPEPTKDWSKAGMALGNAILGVVNKVINPQYEEWRVIVGERIKPIVRMAEKIGSKEDMAAVFQRLDTFAEAIEEMWTDNWPPRGLSNEVVQTYVRYNQKNGGKSNGAWSADQLKKPVAALRAQVDQGRIPAQDRLSTTGSLVSGLANLFGVGGGKVPPKSATKAADLDALEMLRGDVLRYVGDAKARRGYRAAKLLEAYGQLLGSISRGAASGEVTKPQQSALYGHAQVVEDALAELGMDRQADRLVELRDILTASLKDKKKSVRVEKVYRAGKKWMARARACDKCKKLAKSGAVREDADFKGGIPGPPLHPNCRCALKKGFFPMK